MRVLSHPVLRDALLYIQRTHRQPEQVSTAMLLKFQRDLDTLDQWIVNVQTSAGKTKNAVVLAEQLTKARRELDEALAGKAALQRSLDETGRSDLVEFVAQLQNDFGTADLDALYDAIRTLRPEAPVAPSEPANEPATAGASGGTTARGRTTGGQRS